MSAPARAVDAGSIAACWDTVMPCYHEEILGPFHPGVSDSLFFDVLAAALTWAAARQPAGAAVRLLDAGCGPGNLLPWLSRSAAARAGAVDYTGVDLSGTAVRLAQQRAAACSFPAQVRVADLTRPDVVAAGQFDVLVAVNSLLPPAMAGPDPRAAVGAMLATLRSAAAPGASAVLVVPAHDALLAELAFRARRGQSLSSLERSHHVDRRWRLADNGFGLAHCLHDEWTLAQELTAAGFVGVEVQRLDYPESVASLWCRSGRCWDWLVCASM